MKWNNLILLALTLSVFNSCLKSREDLGNSNEKTFIAESRRFFDSATAGNHATNDYKSGTPRSISWDKAKAFKVAGSYSLVVPIEYQLPLFVKTEFSGNCIFHLNDLSQLVIYRDGNRQFHLEVVTKFPDTSYLRYPSGTYSGFAFVDDWWGNNLDRYLFKDGKARKYRQASLQSESILQVCSIIYGYNYSPGDPGGGYSWSQAVGCYYMYLPDATADSYGSRLGVGLGYAPNEGSSGGGSYISIPPPDNPIANISDYIKCFTNVGGSDHKYTVTLCVDQPIPGTRAPYKTTDGGPIGSSNAGNIVDVGHTFLIFSEHYGNTTITRNVGFYPSKGVTPRSPSAPGKLNNDENHSYNISATFSVTNADFFLILSYAARGSDPNFYYNLNSENCTNYALQSLAQGRINLPNTIGSWLGGMGCNPGDLGEDIRQMVPPSNMTKGTVYNFHPNVGTCQ